MALSESESADNADGVIGEGECTLNAAHTKLVGSQEAESKSKVYVGAVEEAETILILVLKHATSRAGKSLTMREMSLTLCLTDTLLVASSKGEHGHQKVSGDLGGGKITKERDLVHDAAEGVDLGEEDADEISPALRCNVVDGQETLETRPK